MGQPATAEERLEAVMLLLERELETIAQAADDDYEYLSLGGNGTNALEVYSALKPVVEEARRIAKGGVMVFMVKGTTYAREEFEFEIEAPTIDEARADATTQAIEEFIARDFEVQLTDIKYADEEEEWQ